MRVISRLHHQGLIGRNRRFLPIYVASLLIAFHYYLIIYVNSSFLNSFFSFLEVAALFALGAILFAVFLLAGETFVREIKLRKIFLALIVLEGASVATLAFSREALFVALAFIVAQGSIGFLSYIMDVMLERKVQDEKSTGEVRGMFLTAANISLVIAPTVAGIILSNGNFSSLYLVSFLVLLPVIFLHFNKRAGEHVIPKHREVLPKTLKLGIFLNFLLQFFYAWMVIWSPIYLHNVIGFAWSEIGIMFSLMLLPFALFELPLGELEDKMFGEKEIMAIGFFIAGLATASLGAIGGASFLLWTLALFATRTGASAIEISTESYFFKHVSGRDAGTIGVFRMAKPLSLLTGPLAGALTIKFLGFPASFAILGAVLAVGAFISLRLKDTR